MHDSPLEGAVTSEPVSESGMRIRGDSEGFIDGFGSIKREFWARIGSNFVFAVQLPLLRAYSKALNYLWFFPLAGVALVNLPSIKRPARPPSPVVKIKPVPFQHVRSQHPTTQFTARATASCPLPASVVVLRNIALWL